MGKELWNTAVSESSQSRDLAGPKETWRDTSNVVVTMAATARLGKLVNDVQVFPMRLVDDDAQQLTDRSEKGYPLHPQAIPLPLESIGWFCAMVILSMAAAS